MALSVRRDPPPVPSRQLPLPLPPPSPTPAPLPTSLPPVPAHRVWASLGAEARARVRLTLLRILQEVPDDHARR